MGTFFDDMIVFSKTEEEHREHLAKVFEELRNNHLVINGKKSGIFHGRDSLLGAHSV